MDRETALLHQLAERPEDRALRLVFSDWLLEQGDPRGEVIALCERGDLSLTERRKVARLTTQHQERWLGPLRALADLHRTRFVDGFLRELVCTVLSSTRASSPLELRGEELVGALQREGATRALQRRALLLEGFEPAAADAFLLLLDGTPASAQRFLPFVGEPRLATVRSLTVPATQQPSELHAFLAHPVLRGLQRLELGSVDWRRLEGFTSPTLAPREVVVGSWGTFDGELTPLRNVALFRQGHTLGLSTTEFINGLVVADVVDSLARQAEVLSGFRAVRLVSRYGVLEGSAAWLLVLERLGRLLPALEAWSVESGEVAFTRARGDDGRFRHLEIDLSLPEGQGEKQLAPANKSTVEVRIAAAASVLVLLGPAKLASVEVKLANGARLRPAERNTLIAAARRSGSLERFAVNGDAVLP